MNSKVLSALRDLVPEGAVVTCALSGGADSVAMTHLLATLAPTLGFTLRACHLNHHLRGDESDADARFCADFCQSLGIELSLGDASVRTRMTQTGESLEEAARVLRYDFFAREPGLVATAHTADDNLETLLLALLRGTGLKGLCGIPPQRDRFIRPLLTCTRQEVLAYLEAHHLPYREDSTNATDDCLRNRLRHRVIPLLKAENPTLADSAVQLTALLRADEALLQTEADTLLSESRCGENRYRIPPLRSAPTPVLRRALRTVLTDLGVRKLSSAHLLGVESLVTNTASSKEVSLPEGLVAKRRYETLTLGKAQPPAKLTPQRLTVPFTVALPQGAVLSLRESAQGVRIRADLLREGVTLRSRQTGDRITLHGCTKTLKARMIDAKLPRELRDFYPVLVCGDTLIAALPFGIDDGCLAAENEAGYELFYQKESE